MKTLAVVVSHPIQYYAPVFQLLTKENIKLKVFYTWGENSVKKYDPDFNREVEWDIPLLNGYDYVFLENTSLKPGTTHFKGIINSAAITEINKFNPDVILIYGWAWHSHLKIIRHYAGKKKVWFRGDSTLLDRQTGYKKLFRIVFLRWIYKHIHIAFFVGTQNKAYFKRFGVKESQLRFAPHAIDNSRFSTPVLKEAEMIRTKLGIPLEGILLLFAGKLEPKKDPATLLKAFSTLSDSNLYLLFVGNGVLEKEVKQQALDSDKKGKIFFLDFQNQTAMPAIYQACQLFCLPSVGPGETWGLAVNEAMAAGCALLVSDQVGCAVDLVTDGINGYIFEAGNKEALAERIIRLTRNADKLKEMGAASRKTIKDWSFQKQIAPILNELKADNP